MVEWWSGGVMGAKTPALHYSITPLAVHHSITPLAAAHYSSTPFDVSKIHKRFNDSTHLTFQRFNSPLLHHSIRCFEVSSRFNDLTDLPLQRFVRCFGNLFVGAQAGGPGGTNDNSPALKRPVGREQLIGPEGTVEIPKRPRQGDPTRELPPSQPSRRDWCL